MGRGHLVTRRLFSEDGVSLPHGVKSVPILGHRLHDDNDDDNQGEERRGAGGDQSLPRDAIYPVALGSK